MIWNFCPLLNFLNQHPRLTVCFGNPQSHLPAKPWAASESSTPCPEEPHRTRRQAALLLFSFFFWLKLYCQTILLLSSKPDEHEAKSGRVRDAALRLIEGAESQQHDFPKTNRRNHSTGWKMNIAGSSKEGEQGRGERKGCWVGGWGREGMKGTCRQQIFDRRWRLLWDKTILQGKYGRVTKPQTHLTH